MGFALGLLGLSGLLVFMLALGPVELLLEAQSSIKGIFFLNEPVLALSV